MMQTIQDKSVQLLETIVERLESFEKLQNRPRVFAKGHSSEGQDVHIRRGSVSSEDSQHEE
jgi:hypothetical protein